ncbi:hypothetical protein ACI797_27050 [Geodermatophilus sp. SYSU D00691]
MTRAWPPGTAAAALVTALLAGCTVGTERTPEPTPSPLTSTQALPARPTDATTDLPGYAGPPTDAPPSAGPLTTVRAAVDLSPAAPGPFWKAEAAVARADGGAYVVLTEESEEEQRLVTVAPSGEGLAVGPAVPFPRVANVVALHVLPDGAVAVAGRLPSSDVGYQVVDPVTGAVRTWPLLVGAGLEADARSALSPDGRVLHLVVTAGDDAGTRETLFAVDAASGRVLAERDVTGDVGAVSAFGVGRQLAALVARPGGGATLVFDASPTDVPERRIPTLLAYDAGLVPAGEPVRVTSLAEGAETQAVAATPDGTVFLTVDVQDGAWVLAVPDGGGAGPVLVQLPDRVFDYTMTVEAAQVWALLPDPVGARAVDLRTGEERGPLDVGCAGGPDVRAIVPAAQGALLVGQCNLRSTWVQMLWLATP